VWRFGRGDGTNQSKIDDSIPAVVGWAGGVTETTAKVEEGVFVSLLPAL
jgi:hypothetical protein